MKKETKTFSQHRVCDERAAVGYMCALQLQSHSLMLGGRNEEVEERTVCFCPLSLSPSPRPH